MKELTTALDTWTSPRGEKNISASFARDFFSDGERTLWVAAWIARFFSERWNLDRPFVHLCPGDRLHEHLRILDRLARRADAARCRAAAVVNAAQRSPQLHPESGAPFRPSWCPGSGSSLQAPA